MKGEHLIACRRLEHREAAEAFTVVGDYIRMNTGAHVFYFFFLMKNSIKKG